MKFEDYGSPFQAGKVLKTVVERVPTPLKIERQFKAPTVPQNPYISIQQYQKDTGLLVGGMGIDAVKLLAKPQVRLIGRRVGDRFSEEKQGLYVLRTGQEPIQLTNFYFEIVGLFSDEQRNGELIESIVVRIPGSKETFKVTYKDYESILDKLLKANPELCICPEFYGPHKVYFREYSAILYKEAKETLEVIKTYSFHGWHFVMGRMKYLSATSDNCFSKCIIPSVNKQGLDLVWRRGFHFLKVGKDRTNNYHEKEPLSNLRAILPFFLYCHAGFAAKLFRDAGLDLQFLLVLVGDSGSLKTAICKAFAQPFNEQELLNFCSTDRAIELYREKSLDMNMILDDIFSNQDKSTQRKFEKILRAYGDNIGRAKADATYNKIEQIEVRGSCIVTAEHALQSQQSSSLRYVTVNVRRDSFDGTVLAKFQENERIAKLESKPSWIQQYFAAWICYLEENYNEIVQQISSIRGVSYDLQFKRLESSYRIFHCLAALILQWGRSINGLSEQDEQELYKDWSAVLKDLMLFNEQNARISEPWQQFLQVIQKGIGTGAAMLAANNSIYESSNNRYIGYVRNVKGEEEYILAPEKTFLFVKRWLEEQGKVLMSDDHTIYKKLCEAGITSGYSNKDGKGKIRSRYLKRVKLNGQQVEMLVVNVEAMQSQLSNL